MDSNINIIIVYVITKYTVFYHLLLFKYVDIWYLLILIKIIELAWQLLFILVILIRIALVLEWYIALALLDQQELALT